MIVFLFCLYLCTEINTKKGGVMENNLIEQVKRTQPDGIFSLLEKFGEDSQVYSVYSECLTPQLDGQRAYIFARDGQFLAVLIDLERPYGSDTLADEEKFADEEPLYFEERTHRVSPVYRLLQFSHALRQACRLSQLQQPEVYCVLLTQSYIINFEDMQPEWEYLGVSVFHHIGGLRKRFFNVNGEADTLEARQMKAYLTYQELVSWELDSQFDRVPEDYTSPAPPTPAMKSPKAQKLFSFGLDDDDDADLPDPQPQLPDPGALRLEIVPPMPHAEAQKQLDNLVGCQQLKAFVADMLDYAEYNHRLFLADRKSKPLPLCLNAVFMGNPGTAKSTVARLMGSLLRGKVLSKGHVVMTTRSTYVGQHWGMEEERVDRVFEMSEGGVLVIDEAYMLMGAGHREDPAKLVLPLMLSKLADEREQQNRMVILCGYSKPMKQLLDTNPGLTSRFPTANRFEFLDLDATQLQKIFFRKLDDYGSYQLTRTARERVRAIISRAYAERDKTTFGNGRYVTNLLYAILRQHSRRVVKANIRDREHLYLLTAADIQPLEVPDKGISIGFSR